MGSFELLEHTADVGVRATGATLECCFEQATWGLASIMGIDRPGEGNRADLDAAADDVGGLLVDWLNEVIYLHEAHDAAIAGVDVHSVAAGRATGSLSLARRGAEPAEGIQVKAVTYHQLRVEHTGEGVIAEVFFDV